MEIVFFSGIPFFPRHTTGGAQQSLGKVVRYLGKRGHHIRILSSARAGCDQPFTLAEGVEVLPILQVQHFPEVCNTTPYNLTHLILDTQKILATADVLYILDAVLPFSFLYENIPTVQSFRNFIYSDTLANGLSFRRDRLLVNSNYMKGCAVDTMSIFCPQVTERMEVIPNGFDLDVFKPVDPQPLAERLGIPDGVIPLLYPHRPDPRKGIYHVLDVLALYRQRCGKDGDRLRLLIPQWHDGASENDSDPYDRIMPYAKEREVDDLLIFHPWLESADLPAYFSLGRVTFCLGTFPETFGNVHLESIACGTPPIITRVAAYRSSLPESLVAKVDPGDLEGAVDALERLLQDPPDPEIGRRYVQAHYNQQQMVEDHERVFTQTRRLAPLPDRIIPPWHGADLLAVPAWCYRGTRGYYNDYLDDYVQDATLQQLLDCSDLDGQHAISVAQAELASGLNRQQLDHLVRSGLLVRRSPGDFA
jgi:glycosyltransferase involved in cell wall biosynthesis